MTRLYSTAEVIALVPGFTERKAKHWVDRGVLVPTEPGYGQGGHHRWSADDLFVIRGVVAFRNMEGRRSLDLAKRVGAALAGVRQYGLVVLNDDVLMVVDGVATVCSSAEAVQSALNGTSGRDHPASSAAGGDEGRGVTAWLARTRPTAIHLLPEPVVA